MFVKKWIIAVFGVGIFLLMIAEWHFCVLVNDKSAMAIHNFHGICSSGVGQPYEKFIHQLRAMAESGDTNRLVTVLRRADERSRDIYEVWLGVYGSGAIDTDAYEKSISEILK